VGLVEMHAGAVAEEWSTLVNPGRPIPRGIQNLTGITDEMAAAAPPFEALAADLALVLEAAAFDGEPVLLAGHSMGAMTIAAWADAHRGAVADRVRGVALLSTGLDHLTSETQIIRPLPGPFATAQGRLTDSVLETPVSIKGFPVPLLRAAAAYAALGPHARHDDVELTTRMALDCRTRARAGCGRAMARMSLLEKLDALEAPTIVVTGQRDLMTPIAHAERIELALPRSLGLRVDPEAGHMTPLESPRLVEEAIRYLVAATAVGSAESRLPA
jgi:pimeloyl-ACP methyl ester carboxylesterase